MISNKLEIIFDKQRELNLRVGVDTDSMHKDQKAEWLLNYTRAISQETAELVDSVPWSWWKHYQKFDEQNARVEVIDILHFVISAAQVLGMTADDVFELYMAKNRVNHERQDSGYAIKNEDDCRNLV